MAAVDAYSPCPCGSGQKFKWCCQKAESYVDRAERLDRNGQHEAALAVVVDGLTKFPDVPWLHIRKAVSMIALEKPPEALAAVAELLRRQPDHFGAVVLNFRLLLETGDIPGAVGQFQGAFGRAEAEARPRFASLAAMLGSVLPKAGLAASAIKHLELARSLAGADDSWIDSALARARANPSISAWIKNPYRLSKAPEGLGDGPRRQFDEALGWAEQGLWEHAASAFELLSADRAAAVEADRNLGLCRLWLGDHPGAVEALRRSVADPRSKAKPTTDAVDLEALCQTIDDRAGDDPVEEVELSWPIRDRAGLIDRLAADKRCVETAEADDDEDPDAEPASPARSGTFMLLDRPKLDAARPGLKPADLPLVVGRIVVGADSVLLQTRDDGRLNEAIDGFTAVADKTIPPAQPRTKVIGAISRADHVLDVISFPPADLPPADREKLTTALLSEQIDKLWPDTSMPYLGGKTPAAAAKAGGFEIPLRAAFELFEESGRLWEVHPDWSGLRGRLKVPAEPAIDHASVVIDDVPLGRLALLDPKRLDDDRLVRLYERSQEWGLPDTLLAAAREITTRRKLLERERFPVFSVYTDLAMREAGERRRDAALEWARKGRGVDPQARRPVAAASWDMLELQIQMMTDEPEAWVPELVVVMNRYERDQDATRLVLSRLVQAGLIRLAPSEDQAEGMVADSSLLQHLIARYGPRVQTAAGEVGVSATRGGLWTPGAPVGGGGGVWTPGSSPSPSPAAERPRIILPGQ